MWKFLYWTALFRVGFIRRAAILTAEAFGFIILAFFAWSFYLILTR